MPGILDRITSFAKFYNQLLKFLVAVIGSFVKLATGSKCQRCAADRVCKIMQSEQYPVTFFQLQY
jgi:hypothetical protein